MVTLDQLLDGRAIVTFGLGAIATDLPDTGETTDLRTRAAMLDEGIDLIRELWAGRQDFHGAHYDYECGRDDLLEVGRPVRSGSRSGWSEPGRDRSRCVGWREAGATWWLETRWEMPHHSPERMEQIRERIGAGPPGGPGGC